MIRSHNIEDNLRRFKRRYYLQALLRGMLCWASLNGVVFFVIILLESQFWLPSVGRGVLYFLFVSVCAGSGIYWVVFRLWRLCRGQRLLSDEAVARVVGARLPGVRDTLLNYVQLRPYAAQSRLAQAGLARRARALRHTPFIQALPWRQSSRFLKYFLPTCGIFLLAWWINPQFITQSSERLYNYEQVYAVPAPFRFMLQEGQSLAAFADEPFELHMRIQGKYVPERAYIVAAGRYIRMQSDQAGRFAYRFEGVHKDLPFHFEADGYKSVPYTIRSLQRPSLLQVLMWLRPPAYTGMSAMQLKQLKNLDIPEGTWLEWQLKARSTDHIALQFSDSLLAMAQNGSLFSARRRFLTETQYSLALRNVHSTNKEALRYHIHVSRDESPQLYPRFFVDTVLYTVIIAAGSATDDYGLSNIQLQYKLQRKDQDTKEGVLAVPFVRQSRSRATFYLDWQLDSLGLGEGDQLSYRLRAWDNDGIRGAKAGHTPWHQLRLPESQVIQEQLINESKQSSNSAAQSQTQSKNLQKQIENLQEQLKLKKKVDWQDKKQLRELLKTREDITKKVDDLKEQYNRFEEKVQRFDRPPEEIQEKMTQLRQLLDEVLDPETKKLYEELKRLLEEKIKLPEVQDLLDKLSHKEQLQSKNLERTLQLIKRLQYDLQTNQVKKQLQKLKEAQQVLREKTKEKKPFEALADEQKALREGFKAAEETLKKLQNLNEELGLRQPVPDLEEERRQVRGQQAESEQQLRQGSSKKAQQAQQAVEQAIRKMQDKLEKMQMQAQAMQIEVDVALMQKLQDNLITLSLQQEVLETSTEEVLSYLQQDDIARQQFDIQEAARATLDSLEVFAMRNFQISGAVHKEIQNVHLQLEESLEAMRERKSSTVHTKQRYIMTGFNKLALFVGELLDKLAQSQGNVGLGQGDQPSLSEFQEQLLKQLQELRKSDKKGEVLSEELARMIAEQEEIRRRTEELLRSREGLLFDKENLKKLIEKMKEVERQLSYKELSDNLIQKQREIKTRLLDFERAAKEDKEDRKRKSEQAKPYELSISPAGLKPYVPKQQDDLLQLQLLSVPLNVYYEEEVRKYFLRLQKAKEKNVP